MNRGKRKLNEEDNSGGGGKKNANAVDVTVDHGDEDDDDDLDEFENDGFIVGDNEEGEEDEDGKAQWKTKKTYSDLFDDFVLDDDDLELLQENKLSGIGESSNDKLSQGYANFKRLKKADTSSRSRANSVISDDDESLCDDDTKEEVMSDAEEDEMADFIVDDEIGYQVEVQTRQSKRVTVASSSVPEEAGRMFGNMDEILNGHVIKVVQSDDMNGYGYATERNNRMNKSDVPERMQMSEEIAGPAPVDEKSREEESSWILDQLSSNTCFLNLIKGPDVAKRISKEDIMTFLELRHVEKYDIPFIAMYRKEKCRSLLEDEDSLENENYNQDDGKLKLKWHKVLWAIDELDKKYLLIQKRKNALQTYYNRRYEDERRNFDDVAKRSALEQQFATMIKSLKSAETERDIDDVDAKFNMYFPPSVEGKTRKLKHSSRIFEYSNCSEAGLSKLAGKFGCSAEQFALHLTLQKVGMDSWEDPAESPETIALNFLSPTFETPEAALKGARLMAAMEISREPCVKKHFRGVFMEKALVSTCPTPVGDKTIDSFHLFHGVKWLSDKPVDKFEEVQWLLIQKAEEENLLQVTMNIPEIALNKLISESHEFFLPSSGGDSAQLWNEQRRLIMQDAFFNFLLPSLEKETRDLLAARAKNWLLEEYRKQLWRRASVAPYQQSEGSSGQEKVAAPRVMACCWGPGKPPITFVMLGSSGQLVDVLETRSLGLRSQNIIDQQRKKYDQQRVLKFISNHKPSVIVFGALNISCTWLKDEMDELILNIKEAGAVDKTIDNLSIVYGDLSLADIYETSEASSCQLPGQQGIVKRAVALGRYLQNPLAMIATLCGPQKEIVSWKLNSLDNFLTPDEKYGMIERVLLDITNQVGIDVDFAQSNDWLLAPLQFVSGLGPQKASFLQRELLGGKTFNSRYDMASCGLMGKKIFYNAVGFLRVHSNYLLSASSELALLDDTRVHPESYVLAEKFVKAVVNDDSQEQPLLYIKDNPELLEKFNVDGYAEKYKTEHGERKHETLHAIKNELLHGFLDPRVPYENLTQDELFVLISGKNEDAFAEGRIIQVTVRRVLAQRAFCDIDSGLSGVIMKEDYFDGGDDFSLPEKLHEGDSLTCKIKYLDKTKYQVYLTCKESEVRSCRNQNPSELDQYYSKGKKNLLVQQNEAQKDEIAKKHFKQRNISHSHFKNITSGQAIEFLSDKDVGESIFHPSTRGPSYLTLTLKVYDGLFVHKDIIEGDKDCTTISSLLYIGKSLKIGDSIFNNLDEVFDRFVSPLVSHLKAMINFRKFKKGSKAEIDGLLKAEKAEYPKRIPYCFGVSYEHPGTFILSYIRTNLHHEYVGVYPEGFKYRKQIFAMVEQVVAYFQKHIDDPIPKGNLSSSTEGSNDGGWGSQFGSGGEQGHPSGLPRPNGERGRGRGRGRRGRGRRDDSDNNGNDYTQNDNYSGGWSGGGSGNSDDKSDTAGEWSGRGRGNRGGRGGRRGRGRGFNSESDNDSGGGNWGAGSSSSWGVGNSDGNSSGGNAGGGWSSSFGSESKDSGGGSGWGGGDKKNWGSEESGGGGSGWGGGSKKNGGSEEGGGGSGWGDGGNKNLESEDNGGGGSGWGGGGKKSWGSEEAGGGWGGGGKKNLESEDNGGGGSGWGGGGKKSWGSGNSDEFTSGGWSDRNEDKSDTAGEWSGRGRGNRGGRGGRRGRGRGFSGSDSDSGYNTSNWGSNDNDKGKDDNRNNTSSGGGNWGAGSGGSWGGKSSDGNSSGGTAGGGWSSSFGSESKGILGSGPSSPPNGGKKNWGGEESGGGGGGWGGGGKKNWGSEESGGSGWGGGGKKSWESEDNGGGGSGWGGGGKKSWGGGNTDDFSSDAAGEWSGRGRGNRGGRGGRRERGRGFNSGSDSDSGYNTTNWGSNDNDNRNNNTSSGGGNWGAGSGGSWGGKSSDGNSAAAGGNSWGGGSSNNSGNKDDWGSKDVSGGSGGGGSSNSGKKDGWGGEDSGGNKDGWGGGGSINSAKKEGWGGEDSGGGSGWGAGGNNNGSGKKDASGSEDGGGGSGWGGGGNTNSGKKDGWGSGGSGGW